MKMDCKLVNSEKLKVEKQKKKEINRESRNRNQKFTNYVFA